LKLYLELGCKSLLQCFTFCYNSLYDNETDS